MLTESIFSLSNLTNLHLSTQVNSLREIQAIKRLAPHPNIVKLEEVLFDPPSGRLALVFELLEGNLYELMKGKLWLDLFHMYSTDTWLSTSQLTNTLSSPDLLLSQIESNTLEKQLSSLLCGRYLLPWIICMLKVSFIETSMYATDSECCSFVNACTEPLTVHTAT